VGGYPLAWIGQVRGARVVPTAACGPAADYTREITVTVEGEFGKGPTGTSIREGHPVVNQDFLAEEAMGPWREKAVSYGFRSSAALPLRRGGAVVGALTLYAGKPGAFDAEQTGLLDALVADLSYAQDAIEDEHRRALAEESLARSEAQLREADERKSQFLAMLSHELRNPLTPIKNSLHILNRVTPNSEQSLRAKAVIERQVDQLARLVDDLLDVTRLTRGKFRLESARLDLVDAVRRTAEDHKPLLASAGIDFEVELSANPLWIHADAARLVQVVGNLLSNAAKFTPKGGKVTLSVRKASAEFATLCVRDTGVGIAKELLPRLFEPFMQAENTLDRSKGGLGLGLALVKGVVEMHGGTVEPHSEGPGCGAEFIIRLPMETGPHTLLADGKVALAPHQSRRVLVIEDNVDAAISLRDVLVLCGHEVEMACDGHAGMEKARVFRPEVVICDIGLPRMDGYEVAKAMRADADLYPIRLVALSGYAQPEDLQRSLAAGFDAHLAKPASAEAIAGVVTGSVESLHR
jgi:two-component system CheB/CheR fusion protein